MEIKETVNQFKNETFKVFKELKDELRTESALTQNLAFELENKFNKMTKNQHQQNNIMQ